MIETLVIIYALIGFVNCAVIQFIYEKYEKRYQRDYERWMLASFIPIANFIIFVVIIIALFSQREEG